MQRIVGTLAVVLALAATGAQAENTASERRAQLDRLWGKSFETAQGPIAAAAEQSVIAARQNRKGNVTGHWRDNYAGGRKHPPAGH